MTEIVLTTAEGDDLKTTAEIMKPSHLIGNILQDSGVEEKIPLEKVKGDTLKKIIDYCDHYKDQEELPKIEKPLRSDFFEDYVDEWLLAYLDLEVPLLLELVEASNYLDIASLFELTCAAVANKMKNKTVDALRDEFDITNDLTENETQEINTFFDWCDDLF
jgi:S-phase kinase-associated protein 1